MNPIAFTKSTAGRVALGAVAYLAAGAGVVALRDPGSALPALSAALTIPAIVAFIASVLLALEGFGAEVMAMLLALPICAGLYLAALQVIPGAGVGTGVPLLAIGAGLGWLAARNCGQHAPPASS